MSEIDTALGVVGATPVVLGARATLVRYLGGRRLLQMQSAGTDDEEELAVIVTTSATDVSPVGPEVRRHTTGIGQIRALAECAQSVGFFYRRMPISPRMSREVPDPDVLDTDVVLLGGLDGNDCSIAFVERIRQTFGEISLYYNDAATNDLRVGSFACENYPLNQSGTARPVTQDLGLIVFWRNPWAQEVRRAILCLGFSSFGTGAAARYAFRTIVPSRWRDPRSERPKLKRVRDAIRKPTDCVICVIETFFSLEGGSPRSALRTAWRYREGTEPRRLV